MLRQFDVVIDPLLPLPVIALGLAAALVLVVLLGRAGLGWRGLALRVVLACVLAAMLANPQLRRQQRAPLADIAVVVADLSGSQQLDGRDARTRKALAALRERLAALPGTQVRVRELAADDGVRGTRLMAALRQALAEVPPERFAGAFLVTDGRVHDMPARVAQVLPPGYAGPVHVLISGRRDERDRWVRITRAGRYGIIGKTLPLRFRVMEHGGGRQAAVTVRLRVNGREWRQVRTVPGREVAVQVPVEHAGQNVVEIIAPAMRGGELSERNNHVVHVFKGVRDRLRVLLISGKPHPGERIWRDLLKSDPMVDLVHFTILRPPEKQDGTPISELALIAFPTYELFVEKLRNFDLIIFDRYQRRGIMTLEYLQNVADHVRGGGAVLLTVGPEFTEEDSLYHTPLADIMPLAPSGRVVEMPYRARLSGQGRRHPLTAALARDVAAGAAAWGRWFRLVDTVPAAGGRQGVQVLMQGPGERPLLALSRVGEGRVAMLLSDHVWLWARQYDGGGPHVELMRRLAHWLMKEPDLEEEQLTAGMRGSTLVVTRRTLADRAPPLQVTLPDGRRRTLAWRQQAPGMFVAELADAPVGLYHLRSGELKRVFPVGAVDVAEFRDLVATDGILAPLATASGGGVRWIAGEDGAQVRLPGLVKVAPGSSTQGRGWLGIVRRDAARVLAVRHFPVFAGLVVLSGLLVLLGLAWRLESR